MTGMETGFTGRNIAGERRLVLRGHTVFRYAWTQILFAWPAVEAEILAAMARGLHLAVGDGRR
jgi:uncharacterized protein YqjF (DUF2071 family)